MRSVYRVFLTEYERGWGSRPEGHSDFDTFEKAKEYQTNFNKDNTGPVPDWYMIASEPRLVDLDRG